MPSGINILSPDIRDFLLNRNLIADTVVDNGLSSLLVGIGAAIPNMGTIPEAVQASDDIETLAPTFRGLMTLTNPYGTTSGYPEININTDTVINIGNLPPGTSQLEYNSAVGSSIDGSVFNQAGDEGRKKMLKNKYIDVDQQTKVQIVDNIYPDSQGGNYFDESGSLGLSALRGSLIGRTLAGVGAIDDTQVGIIGGEQLLLHLGYNSAFNLAQETIGNINLNPFSLANPNGQGLVVPNYDVTVPKGQLGKILDFGARVLGFEVPVSILDRSASIFQDENNIGNIERANNMIANTGKGQVLALFNNILANKDEEDKLRMRYRPGFKDERTGRGINRADTPSPQLYVGNDGEGGFIDVLNPVDSDNQPTNIANSSFNPQIYSNEFDDLSQVPRVNRNVAGYVGEAGPEQGFTDFIWGDKTQNNRDGGLMYPESPFRVKKSLLYKTRRLFDSGKMRTLVSGHGDLVGDPSEIQKGTKFGFISKGSGVLSSAALNGSATNAAEIFCRTWTTAKRYDQVQNLQKNDELNPLAGLRFYTENSVLGDNGFAKIAPDSSGVKNLMFSIENLAWADVADAQLPECEIGPGDITNNTKGRIMWFPPYDLNFTDTSSVNLDSVDFIGRGEPLYTYNNTERTGTLSFKVLADHPSFLNYIGSETDDILTSIMAGCEDITETFGTFLSENEKNELKKASVQAKQTKNMPKVPKKGEFSIYFANDSAIIDDTYEDGDGTGLGTTVSDGGFNSRAGTTYPDDTDDGLNETWIETSFQDDLKTYLTETCEHCRIDIKGYASTQGSSGSNQTLSTARANAVKQWFTDNILNANDPILSKRFKVSGDGEVPNSGTDGDRQDNVEIKKARKVTINFIPDANLYSEINGGAQERSPDLDQLEKVSKKIKSRFFNECDYFERLKKDDSFIYSTLREKFRYFHPSFHSVTPEGLNSRLTFLKQCTRQGPTGKEGDNITPKNLAFGRPPVCILRIGDFYHTKIMMDNVSLSYEQLWDLNPEGVGVQPMIVNVDISFKFIGGSSLAGPINKLQNALSFNYFANTGVYDPRADYAIENGIEEGYSPNDIEDIEDEVTKNGLNGRNPETLKNQVVEAEKDSSASETEPEPTEEDKFRIDRDGIVVRVGLVGANAGVVNPSTKFDIVIDGATNSVEAHEFTRLVYLQGGTELIGSDKTSFSQGGTSVRSSVPIDASKLSDGSIIVLRLEEAGKLVATTTVKVGFSY
jgi:hypothetical protein